jgi:pantoate--beta-alanine ligase
VEVIRTVAALRARCDDARASGARVAFVPTMGALHEGHAALLRRAREVGDLVVLSIFVNPLQFGDPADLSAYPRDEVADLAIAERIGVDVAFLPSAVELYPEGRVATVDPGPVGERLEGASRPGHFRGVATVVLRLFDAVGPCVAVFGEKDAQQVAVIRRMIGTRGLPVALVVHPTVRERDGLARSSRNARLTPADRAAAGCLFLALSEAAELVRGGERDARRVVAAMAREIGATPEARLDYAAVVDEDTFEEVARLERPARAVVAARFGEVRLIDTIALPLPRP